MYYSDTERPVRPVFLLPIWPTLTICTSKCRDNYTEIYDDEFLRISTLPYDIIALINFIYSKEYKLGDVIKLLNNPNKKFNGVDGNFYFKNNMIETDLNILKINNGNAFVIN